MEKVDLIKPLHLEECYSFLNNNGAVHFCIFGGAVRDSDNKSAEPIKDYDPCGFTPGYDFRVWFDDEKKAHVFVTNLKNYGCQIEPCIGSDYVRYVTKFQNIELDISYRMIPKQKKIQDSSVAQERAAKADVGLSAVAMDPTGQGWCTPEYFFDKQNQTITVYPNPNEKQVKSYVKRMLQKYPKYDVIYL